MKVYLKNNFEIVVVVIGILIAIVFTIIGNFIDFNGEFSPTILAYYGGFIGGTVGVFFTFAGYLIINKSFQIQRRQAFENLFFSTFKEFNEFRTKQIGLLYLPTELSSSGELRKLHAGYKFFETIFETTLGFTEINIRKYKTTKDKIKTVFIQNRSQMAHYFSHINMLIYSVNNGAASKIDKEFFMKYIANQLSEQEKFLVFYHKLHPDYMDFNFLELIEIKNKNKIEILVE